MSRTGTDSTRTRALALAALVSPLTGSREPNVCGRDPCQVKQCHPKPRARQLTLWPAHRVTALCVPEAVPQASVIGVPELLRMTAAIILIFHRRKQPLSEKSCLPQVHLGKETDVQILGSLPQNASSWPLRRPAALLNRGQAPRHGKVRQP